MIIFDINNIIVSCRTLHTKFKTMQKHGAKTQIQLQKFDYMGENAVTILIKIMLHALTNLTVVIKFFLCTLLYVSLVKFFLFRKRIRI